MKKTTRKIVSGLFVSAMLGMNLPVHADGLKIASVNDSAQFFHPAALKEKGSEQPVSSDTLVVKYSRPLSQSELQKSGAVLLRQMPALNTAVIKVKNKNNMEKALKGLSSLKHVKSIQPSITYKSLGSSDPKASKQYYLDMLSIAKAQNLAGSKKVRVAVIDEGVDMNHPELKKNLLPSYNAANPMSAAKAGFHGTHVAGIIAGIKDNSIGGYGISPQAEILPVDVFDRGWGATDYAAAQGILYAIEKKAKVINMSFGGMYPSQVLKDAVAKAVSEGITVIAAAGNTGDESVNYPAAFEGVISVGNVDEKKQKAVSSTYGPSMDIVAPGENIYSTYYDLEKKSTFGPLSGTSMAAPVVSGTAALLLSKYPSLSNREVEYILKHSADDLGRPGFDAEYGYGLVNPVKALSFDMKKIPEAVKSPAAQRQKSIEKAAVVPVGNEKVIQGTVTTPQQEDWIKLDVKEGQKVQLTLKGSSQFDYKLNGQWLRGGFGKFEINEAKAGGTEGHLLTILKDGQLAVGVSDANGQYDDSKEKQSRYELKIEIKEEAPEDKSSAENPITVNNLPWSGKEETLFSEGEEKDEDVYSFKSAETQAVRVQLKGLPGVNTGIGVYRKAEMEPGTTLPEGEEIPLEQLAYSNSKGIGQGEELVFQAEKDADYLIKVTNQPEPGYGPYDYFFYEGEMETNALPKSSLDAYELKIEGKVFPEDEDQFMMGGQEPIEEEQATKETGMEEEQNMASLIKEIALPVSTAGYTSGYLQQMEDQDWYRFTAESSGLYAADFSRSRFVPSFEGYQIEELEAEAEGEKMEYLMPIGSNFDYGWAAPILKDKVYLSLEKGKTYYFQVQNDFMNFDKISFDPYEFKIQKVKDFSQDASEPNDKFEDAKTIKGGTLTSTFSKSYDTDIYYMEADKTELYSIGVSRTKLTDELKKAYPQEVLQPFYSYIAVIPDANKNHKADEAELNKAVYIERGLETGSTYGSFKAHKGINYFIAVSSYMEGSGTFTLMPYKLNVKPAVAKDEDAHNSNKEIGKIKPVKLVKSASGAYSKKGWFNPGIGYGDEDWYSFTVGSKHTVSISLTASQEIDGVIELYQNGKKIASSDLYQAGDAETLRITLAKGQYWVKVKEALNQASAEPYELKIQ
ncbi:S8 family serine peptidase [Bacillus infantis]|uniref:S8 family serine peptidase n=1 Tax=Bacillus infantis TaxID=324767 RepID=UPI0021557128|nr:S8 family serine peptidase [Bacillus infantis]MCR6612967.1 S8 family serine peptidase [Bacillus infantis]